MRELIRSSPGLVKAARTVAIPWRLGWAVANRRGWLGEAPVGDEPHLDPEALARWREEIARARVYLEYGSGGSTVAASRQVEQIVSVDSDARFLAAVAARVRNAPGVHATFTPVPVDIGWTEMWGRPVFTLPTSSRRAAWRRYTATPWEHLDANGLVPDFICVDGRFRVACVLESLLRLPEGHATTIMLDDFARTTTRYHAVLDFADGEQVGRALFLRRKPNFDRARCVSTLAAYQRDPE